MDFRTFVRPNRRAHRCDLIGGESRKNADAGATSAAKSTKVHTNALINQDRGVGNEQGGPYLLMCHYG